MNHQTPHPSSSHDSEDQLLNESVRFHSSIPSVMLEDIERMNRLSTHITLLQLDQAAAFIRAG